MVMIEGRSIFIQLNLRVVLKVLSFVVGAEYFILFASPDDSLHSVVGDLFLLGMFYTFSVRMSQLLYLENNSLLDRGWFVQASLIRALVLALGACFTTKINFIGAIVMVGAFLGLDQIRKIDDKNYISDICLLFGFMVAVVYSWLGNPSAEFLLIVPYIFVSFYSYCTLVSDRGWLDKKNHLYSVAISSFYFAPVLDGIAFNAAFYISNNFSHELSEHYYLAIRCVTAAAFIYPFFLLYNHELKKKGVAVYWAVILVFPLAALIGVNLYFSLRGLTLPLWMLVGQALIFIIFLLYYFSPRPSDFWSVTSVLMSTAAGIFCWLFFEMEVFLFVGLITSIFFLVDFQLDFFKKTID